MIYVFTFLGEFGFELLNWQGVIRKFSRTLSPQDRIICCSRANLYPIYEMADRYIDISEVPLFKQSRASWYWASPLQGRLGWNMLKALRFNRQVKAEIQAYVLDQLKEKYHYREEEPYEFIFSSDKKEMNGCTFGCARNGVAIDAISAAYDWVNASFPALRNALDRLRSFLFRTIKGLNRNKDGNIFDQLPFENNLYRKIEPDYRFWDEVEKKLGWSLREPFILCQSRTRNTNQPSKDSLPQEQIAKLIEELARHVKVVLLSFHTGRWLDSYSEFEEAPNCFHYTCRSFPEQAVLIQAAAHCLFFTEGDFGSHIYVPPFMGKDVTAVAPESVYEVGTTPIDIWNRQVFRFGGRILPKTSEALFASAENVEDLVSEILCLPGIS